MILLNVIFTIIVRTSQRILRLYSLVYIKRIFQFKFTFVVLCLVIAEIAFLLILLELPKCIVRGLWELHLLDFLDHLLLKAGIALLVVINMISKYFRNLFLISGMRYSSFLYLGIFSI